MIGDGLARKQPVYVDDVVEACVAAMKNKASVGKLYDIGGASVVTFNEFLDLIGEAAGARPRKIHLPVPIALMIARTLKLLLKNPPLNPDQVMSSHQHADVDNTRLTQELGVKPIGLKEGLAKTFHA